MGTTPSVVLHRPSFSNMSKVVYTALFALAMVAVCSIYVAVETPSEEMIKAPLPSVDALTGGHMFDGEDKASPIADADDEDTTSDDTDTTSGDSDPFGLEATSTSEDVGGSSSSKAQSLSDGDSVSVEYKLSLADTGKEVYRQWGDDSFTFELGGGHVIPGFNDAVAGMKVGETKTVTIDSDDAYGSKGFKAMGIPPNADLTYTLKVDSKN